MSKRINKDYADQFHDYGIYTPTRTIYMGSEEVDLDGDESGTDAKMAERIIKNLHILDAASNEPILIIMINKGGSVTYGLAIYNAIQACRSHVAIRVYGMAMSMGTLILQAADERILSPDTAFMIHDGYTAHPPNHPKTVENWVEFEKKQDKRINEIYLEKIREKHPKFTSKRLDRMLVFDTLLTAQEAIDLGLADKIEERNR